MNFELNKEQIQIQKAVRDFTRGVFKKEEVQALLENPEETAPILKQAGELGFTGIHLPEAFDGEGLGHVERVIIVQELARAHAGLGSAVALAGTGAQLLMDHGSTEQKETWLPRLASGDILSSCVFETESATADSQVTAMQADGEWVINGCIPHAINGGPRAGIYLILCRTDPENNGWSTFLVEGDRPGIQAVDAGHRLGQNLVPVCRITLDQVRVPQTYLIGRENKGAAQVKNCEAAFNLTLAALGLGTAQGAFDRALGHVRQRRQFGKTLVQFQITRHKLAMMATGIESARLMVFKAARAMERKKDAVRACAMARLMAGQTARQVCDEALQLFGGYGYIREYEIESFYRDAQMMHLFQGGTHSLKDLVAEQQI